MLTPYAQELQMAELAVQRASIVTKDVMKTITDSVISKADDSPVTIADFAAQALLISAIHYVFPGDSFVGEETAELLRKNTALRELVWGLVSSCGGSGVEDDESREGLYTPKSAEEMMNTIDLGCGSGGREGRVWVLDPIDGTAAFVKGGQYVVALALLEDGEEKIGVLGCPNLSLDSGSISEDVVDKEGYGLMVSAVRSQGSFIKKIIKGALGPTTKIERNNNVVEQGALRWVEGTITKSGNLDMDRKIAEHLGAEWPGIDLISWQMRYVALAVGGGNILFFIPKEKTKRLWIWDHIGGNLILHESGGRMLDLNGKELDFGAGRTLDGNFGMIAAPVGMQTELIEMVGQLTEG